MFVLVNGLVKIVASEHVKTTATMLVGATMVSVNASLVLSLEKTDSAQFSLFIVKSRRLVQLIVLIVVSRNVKGMDCTLLASETQHTYSLSKLYLNR